MLDLAAAAAHASGVASMGAWARVENAACARRLAAMADELDRQYAADGSAEREQWCLDNWDAVCAEIGAALNVSAGVASNQLLVAVALRERLPQVGALFVAGQVSYRLVAAVVARTRLILDPVALAKVDAEVATHIGQWGAFSAAKTDKAIDYWVDRYDPAAVRRSATRARGRYFDVLDPDDGSGLCEVRAVLFGPDGAALRARITAIAATVCDQDPRTVDQRRSDAGAALANGADRLVCGCGRPDCPATTAAPPAASAVVVHVIAEEQALTDDTPAQLDGTAAAGPTTAELRQQTVVEALTPAPETGPAPGAPAAVLGGGLLPAPLLAAKYAATATIVPIVHPGDSGPQRRWIPSPVLAWFVRARDMTCRFPGCDEPAHRCDIDHTIAYPHGPTQASNLKCLCRKHHLLKTFGDWLDYQSPDGTVVWTSPRGQTYTTHPGSRLLFPSLCRPTAPVVVTTEVPVATTNRTLSMPRRTDTRAHNRRRAIEEERNKPPPF